MTIEVFVKKPEKVEVLQYDGTNYDEVIEFAGRRFWKIEGFVKGDYIVKRDDYNIVATSIKPDFEEQELIGSYTKDVVQGVNPNVHMSLEKLQECFEVPIVDDREKDVNKIANNNCGVKKYQKKPIIVEAVQNTGDNYSDIMEFTDGECKGIYSSKSKGYVFLIETLEGVMAANVGDYIIKGVKGEFYPCKPDVFEATYDEYNEQQDSNHASKPSSFSLRDLVMQIAPKHIKYYIKRLEEYGFELWFVKEGLISNDKPYLPSITLKDKIDNCVTIYTKSGAYDAEDEVWFVFEKNNSRRDRTHIEVKNNNWREAFNKLVASFPDEIMKNTNHHAGLTS